MADLFAALTVLAFFAVLVLAIRRAGRMADVHGFTVHAREQERGDLGRYTTRFVVSGHSKISLSGETLGIRLVKAITGNGAVPGHG